MRASTNISLKTRRTLSLGNFKGVDFSSSPLNVRNDRASSMRNFINEYGVNKKRNGWNERFCIEGQKINGIFEYVHGMRRELLVHAGAGFYRILYSNGQYSAPEKIAEGLKDQRSQAFFNKGRMYITGCGDFLVYGTWDNGGSYELRRVFDNEDTYIPTTTISIDPDGDEDPVRKSLDAVNCLSTKRKNQLLGRAFKPAVEGKEEVKNEDGSVKTPAVEAQPAEESLTWTLDTKKIDDGTAVQIKLETLEAGTDGNKIPVEYLIQNKKDEETKEYTEKLYKVQKDGVEITYEPCGSLDYDTGKITLTCSTVPQIEGRDNITVTFTHVVNGYADRIANCNFGILFGVNGNSDRLFLSGNADYPNVDFYSEMDDYTYFGDTYTASMGSDSVPVKGYARLSDSTLVIYKAENYQEATIYYRTGSHREKYDASGNLDSLEAVFTTSAGSIGEGVISRHACANFAGDNLILSRNGVFGIALAENVATAARYTRERSRAINEKLKRHDNLDEAVGTVYNGRYYLAVDGVCYVADSRYKYTSNDSADGSFNYEWWFWDNIPARVWAPIGQELYFGCADGRICVFDDQYTDRTYHRSQKGELALDTDNNRIDLSNTFDLAENDKITFSTEVYALLYEDTSEEDTSVEKIKVPKESIYSFHEGMAVYADKVGDSGLSVDTKYYVHGVDLSTNTFQLKNEEGEIVKPKPGGFRLCRLISGVELYAVNVHAQEEKSSFQVKNYKESSSALRLTSYNETTPSDLVATITHIQNVVAEWYTPVFDLGTNESSKTLLKMTISTEPEVNGRISFGYETRHVNKLLYAKGLDVFDFGNFSFNNFTFDTGFANSYSVRSNERNFNFIMFRFISDNDVSCTVNSFSIIYKINKANKGVK